MFKPSWILIPDSLLLTSISSDPQSVSVCLGSSVLGGRVDVFPSYESLSSALIGYDASDGSYKHSRLPARSVGFLQCKDEHKGPMQRELVLEGAVRALVSSGMSDTAAGDVCGSAAAGDADSNVLVCYSDSGERIEVNLRVLFSDLLRSVLQSVIETDAGTDMRDLSCNVTLCVPTPMSGRARGDLLRSLERVSVNSTYNTDPKMVVSSACALSVAFVATAAAGGNNTTSVGTGAGALAALESMKHMGSLRVAAGSGRGETPLESEDATVRFLVVEVGEEYTSASVVEVENPDEVALVGSSVRNEDTGATTVRVLSVAGSCRFGWRDADSQLTRSICSREWRKVTARLPGAPTLSDALKARAALLRDRRVDRQRVCVYETDEGWARLEEITRNVLAVSLHAEEGSVVSAVEGAHCLHTLRTKLRAELKEVLADWREWIVNQHSAGATRSKSSETHPTLVDRLQSGLRSVSVPKRPNTNRPRADPFENDIVFSEILPELEPIVSSNLDDDFDDDEYVVSLDSVYISGSFSPVVNRKKASAESDLNMSGVLSRCITRAIERATDSYTESGDEFDKDQMNAKRKGKKGWKTTHRPEGEDGAQRVLATPIEGVLLYVEGRQRIAPSSGVLNVSREGDREGEPVFASSSVPGLRDVISSAVKRAIQIPEDKRETRGAVGQVRVGRSKSLDGSAGSSVLGPKNSRRNSASEASAKPRWRNGAAALERMRGIVWVEMAAGSLWDGSCLITGGWGHSVRVFEAPPTLGVRVVQRLPSSRLLSPRPFVSSAGIGEPHRAVQHESEDIMERHNKSAQEPVSVLLTPNGDGWPSKGLRRNGSWRTLKAQEQGTITESRVMWVLGTPPDAAEIVGDDGQSSDSGDDAEEEEGFYMSHIEKFHRLSEDDEELDMSSIIGDSDSEHSLVGEQKSGSGGDTLMPPQIGASHSGDAGVVHAGQVAEGGFKESTGVVLISAKGGDGEWKDVWSAGVSDRALDEIIISEMVEVENIESSDSENLVIPDDTNFTVISREGRHCLKKVEEVPGSPGRLKGVRSLTSLQEAATLNATANRVLVDSLAESTHSVGCWAVEVVEEGDSYAISPGGQTHVSVLHRLPIRSIVAGHKGYAVRVNVDSCSGLSVCALAAVDVVFESDAPSDITHGSETGADDKSASIANISSHKSRVAHRRLVAKAVLLLLWKIIKYFVLGGIVCIALRPRYSLSDDDNADLDYDELHQTCSAADD